MHHSFRNGFEKSAGEITTLLTKSIKPKPPNISMACSKQDAFKKADEWIKNNPRPTSAGDNSKYWLMKSHPSPNS